MELLRCTVASLFCGSPGDKQLYRSIQRTTATYVERNEQHNVQVRAEGLRGKEV